MRSLLLLILASLLAVGCGTQTLLIEAPDTTDTTNSVNVIPVVLSSPTKPETYVYGSIMGLEKVYDGDTLKDVEFEICNPCDLRNPMLPFTERDGGVFFVTDIRLKGIDTPETRPWKAGRTQASLDREKALAKQARNYLRYQIHGADAIRFFDQTEDKYYGRIVAKMEIQKAGIWVDVSQLMIDCGYAVAYDGGRKAMDWGNAPHPTCTVPDSFDPTGG